ncbi:MAG TPA: hypothetical protein VHA15_08500 [Burkholderiales bacterium]|jgi:hypothetical protein|nr:hypothetical protein [Burkholderiales bacterium]
MQKEAVPNRRYVELLNEEIQRHPFYRQGMQFMPSLPDDAKSRPKLAEVTWDKQKWKGFDFVFAAAARVVRQRYEVQ